MENHYITSYDELHDHIGHKLQVIEVYDWATNREIALEIICTTCGDDPGEPLVMFDNPLFVAGDKAKTDANYKKYFTGTHAQAETIARFNAYQLNEKYEPTKTTLEDFVADIAQWCGDTAVTVLHEDPRTLVYLSIDTHIEVLTAINKKDFKKSQSIELDN